MAEEEYTYEYIVVHLPHLILASGSPWRKHWLEALLIPFTLVIPNID